MEIVIVTKQRLIEASYDWPTRQTYYDRHGYYPEALWQVLEDKVFGNVIEDAKAFVTAEYLFQDYQQLARQKSKLTNYLWQRFYQLAINPFGQLVLIKTDWGKKWITEDEVIILK